MKEFSTCTHFPSCSGCSLDLRNSPSGITQIRSFFKTFDWISHQKLAWRMRAKLAIRKNGIGLFRKKTHEVVEIPHCKTHHGAINNAANFLKQAIAATLIEPYDEVSQSGVLRYAQFFVCRESEKIQLALVVQNNRVAAKKLAEYLWEKTDLWHSIWINEQPLATNRIFGDIWHHCFGPKFLSQRIGRANVPFHPGAFAQANLSLFDEILNRIERWVAPKSRLLEIYAGVGAISMHLEPLLQSALLIEENPYALLSFRESGSSYSYLQADAKAAISHLASADVIIVDPPRKGLDLDLLEAIAEETKKTLIYISCSFESFKKDAEVLLSSGWEIVDAAGFELFPGTEHIELAVCFKKGDK